jgi:hypothetical protein
MNTDSKLNRYIILLQKTPFILFVERHGYDIVYTQLNKLGVAPGNFFKTIEIKKDTDLVVVITATTKLPDPLAYRIIEALVDTLHETPYLDIESSCDWQEYVKWQNIDAKPAPQNSFTIAVDKFTHKLSVVNTVVDENDYDGVINLHSLDPSIPFPQALLKECVIDTYDIIAKMAVGRTFTSLTSSKYLSVMQTGYDTFYYINMKKLEKDMRAVLEEAGITIEQ